MAMKNKTPESLTDLKKHIFSRTWLWMSHKPAWLKIVIGIIAVIVLLTAARFNFFGNTFYQYSRVLLPGHIPLVDPAIPVIPFSMKYEIEDQLGKRIGKLGDICYSGDQLTISFMAGIPCWVTVFGVDSKGIHPVFRTKLDPSLIEKEQNYPLSFTLDETLGNEIYYAIAAPESFRFQEEIEPFLRCVFPSGNSKGPSFSEYQLELPEKFTQNFIYFNHLSRQ